MNTIRSSDVLVRELKKAALDLEGTVVETRARGAVIGHMTRACGGDVRRRYLLGWIFGQPGMEMSAKYLKPAEVAALIEWVDAYNDNGVWSSSMRFELEVARLMADIVAFMGIELPFEERKR